MSYGIKVSKPGVDVKTALEEELVINSEYFSVKEIVDPAGIPTTLTIASGGYSGSATYNHSLPFIPAYMVFLEDRDGNFFRLPGQSGDTPVGGEGSLVGTVWATSTQIVVSAGFQVEVSPANYTLNLRIFLFNDEGI